MSHNEELTVAVHPIVILSISEFYNRMRVNFGSKRVFGGLVGETKGKKTEIFSNFEFIEHESSTNKQLVLDIEYLESRRKIMEQLYSAYDFLGFFSTNTISDKPDDQDKIVFKTLNQLGCVNPVCLVLCSDLLDKEELPMKVYSFDKQTDSFNQVNHEIIGYDSERICLDTVTKSGGVQNNDNQVVQNIETLRSAVSMLKSNLKSIISNIQNKPENMNDPKYIELLDDILKNFPNSEDPDLKRLLENSIEELLILNNVASSSIGVNYISKTN